MPLPDILLGGLAKVGQAVKAAVAPRAKAMQTAQRNAANDVELLLAKETLPWTDDGGEL